LQKNLILNISPVYLQLAHLLAIIKKKRITIKRCLIDVPLLNLNDRLTNKLKEMDNLLSDILLVDFTYRSKTYFALIRTKMNKLEKRHYVTIMNGELEQLFYGHHIIIDNGGVLSSPEEILNSDLLELNQSVAEALSQIVQEEYEKKN
jgi:hypothetical protein